MIEMFWEQKKLGKKKITSVEIVDKEYFERHLKTDKLKSIGKPESLAVRNDFKRFAVEGFIDDDVEYEQYNLIIVVDEKEISNLVKM